MAIILERHAQPGDKWRRRYDRLSLHDIAEYCHLPHFPMPDTFPQYVPRDYFADYLDAYSRTLSLDFRGGVNVTSIRPRDAGGWRVGFEPAEPASLGGWSTPAKPAARGTPLRTPLKAADPNTPSREGFSYFSSMSTRTTPTWARESPRDRAATSPAFIEARHVVLADGLFNRPHRLNLRGQAEFGGDVLHSSEYKTGAPYAGKKVLVVGFGNSGMEQALDLVEHGADVTVAYRSPGSRSVVPLAAFEEFQESQRSLPFLTKWPKRAAEAIAAALADREGPVPRWERLLAWGAAAALRAVDGVVWDLLDARMARTVMQEWARMGAAGGDLSPYGLHSLAGDGSLGPVSHLLATGRVMAMDVGTVERIIKGEARVVNAEVVQLAPSAAVFSDGTRREFDAIILATGYETATQYPRLLPEAVVKKLGPGIEGCLVPKELRGAQPGVRYADETAVPGLWFLYGNLIQIKEGALALATKIAASG